MIPLSCFRDRGIFFVEKTFGHGWDKSTVMVGIRYVQIFHRGDSIDDTEKDVCNCKKTGWD
jgi:hypothetical protein